MRSILYDDGKIKDLIWGGPYFDRPRNMLGVKMAEEIDLMCHIDIPTKDFGVPSMLTMTHGVNEAVACLSQGKELYVGCMGGIGRTGLFMACMLKTAHERKWGSTWRRFFRRWFEPNISYVEEVRKQYHPYAVETEQQRDFVRRFEVASA